MTCILEETLLRKPLEKPPSPQKGDHAGLGSPLFVPLFFLTTSLFVVSYFQNIMKRTV